MKAPRNEAEFNATIESDRVPMYDARPSPIETRRVYWPLVLRFLVYAVVIGGGLWTILK